MTGWNEIYDLACRFLLYPVIDGLPSLLGSGPEIEVICSGLVGIFDQCLIIIEQRQAAIHPEGIGCGKSIAGIVGVDPPVQGRK